MTSAGKRITERLVDVGERNSLSKRFRSGRWKLFVERFPDISEMRVLDLGGTAAFWRNAEVRPAHVTLLNFEAQPVAEDWISSVAGDACALPEDLPEVDLAFSNSVIEHVGGHWRQQRFAEGARAVAPRYWMQTPYRYFPIEPHFVAPALQFLPRGLQARYVRAWPIGNRTGRATHELAVRAALSINLLSATELRFYFPDAEIVRERVGPLTKSLIALRQ